MGKEIDRVISYVYGSAKKAIGPKRVSRRKVKKAGKEVKHGYAQDVIPVKAIRNGIIQTKTGSYIKILEILPINFVDKEPVEQADIASIFASLFHEGPRQIHIKCITDKSNPSRLISYIHESCEKEKWQRGISDRVVECAKDNIEKAVTISENSSLAKRYFVIYKYEGKSTDINNIFFEMETMRQSITMTLMQAGNAVIDYGYEKSSYEAGEILYYFFNRQSCRRESFQQRIDRITYDAVQLKESGYSNINKKVNDKDLIAPRGLYFSNFEYIYMDGQYKTYLALKEKGHPAYAVPGWLDSFTSIGDGTEVDIYIERLPHDAAYMAIEQYTRVRIVSGNEKVNNSTKRKEIYNQANNNMAIINALEADEDLFNVMIILTISAASVRELKALKTVVVKQLSRNRRYVEEAYANTRDFFLATTPLMEIPRAIFGRNKRNYLTSSLESLYLFTSYEMFDPTGFILGENARNSNSSLVAVNPFNTAVYPNANMAIFGMSGAGKTMSTQIIARAMRVAGQRVFFILPMKAHEYLAGCKAIDGSYIQLAPGSKDRINICEIRPESNIDREIVYDAVSQKDSFLSKKIAFLMTWLQLNMYTSQMTMEEIDIAEVELANLYFDFGISADNSSIYDKDGALKPMPIIGDIYDRFAERPELARVNKAIKKYVTGQCQNMNGPTNVDLTNKFICFDVDEANMNKELLAPFILAAIDCAYSLIRQSRVYLDTIFLDETWRLLAHHGAAELIKDMVKIIRGYGGAVVTITQDINDYISNPAGKAIVANTAIKMVMHLERPECRALAENLGLSEEDIRVITRLKRGQAMIITALNKIVVNIRPSEKEEREFTTDPNKLKTIAEEKATNGEDR